MNSFGGFKSGFHWQFFITHIFNVFLKFEACYITIRWGEFRIKNAIYLFHVLFWYFFGVILIIKFVFFNIYVSFFFCLNFRNRTERRIHDKIFCKIPSELCGLNILKNTLEGLNLSKVVQKLLEVRLLDFDLKLAVCFVEHLLFRSSKLKSRWVFLCFSFLWQKNFYEVMFMY